MATRTTVVLKDDAERAALALMAHDANQGRKPKLPDLIRDGLLELAFKRKLKLGPKR